MKTFTPEFEIKDNAIICNYKSQYELMYSMARFQEFYENPYLKNKLFIRQDLQDIQPDYYVNWNGCNFPSVIFDKMIYHKFEFDRHELVILDFCSKHKKYIIGIHSNNRETLEHELAHAKFYNNHDYRSSVIAHINKFKREFPKDWKMLTDRLTEMGYDETVFYDEIQAYAICGWKKLNVGNMPLSFKKLLK